MGGSVKGSSNERVLLSSLVPYRRIVPSRLPDATIISCGWKARAGVPGEYVIDGGLWSPVCCTIRLSALGSGLVGNLYGSASTVIVCCRQSVGVIVEVLHMKQKSTAIGKISLQHTRCEHICFIMDRQVCEASLRIHGHGWNRGSQIPNTHCPVHTCRNEVTIAIRLPMHLLYPGLMSFARPMHRTRPQSPIENVKRPISMTNGKEFPCIRFRSERSYATCSMCRDVLGAAKRLRTDERLLALSRT
jgi:hypothetical protein